jgi:energy-coupling factor transporter transmembrane protein EcfT
LSFIKKDLDAIGCSPTLQRIIPAVKFAAAIGLVIGLWNPSFGFFVSLCLVVYFVIAVGFHLRAHDKIANSIPPALLAILCVLVATTFR